MGDQQLLEALAASVYDPADGEVIRAEAPIGTFYTYAHREVVLVVQSFDPVVADEVIAALP